MKVLLVNGSPHEKGCTRAALAQIERALANEGIESEVFWLGTQPMGGCIACGGCAKTGLCAFPGPVNAFLHKSREADGFVFASPVHYAAASGAMTAFMDRAFYAGSRGAQNPFAFKPAACVVCARRAGTTAALDQLNKYLTISQMPVVSSCYWNMVHGASPEDAEKDLEGMRVMRVLARNMAWLLKCIEAGRASGVSLPAQEKPVYTNFIRE